MTLPQRTNGGYAKPDFRKRHTASDAIRDVRGRQSVDPVIGGVLAEYIAGLFPQRDPRQVLDGLLGKGDAGWSLGTAPGQGRPLIIQTSEAGVAVSAVARILEQIAPNTLLRPVIYEPLPLQGLSEHRRSLH